ncbi:ArdC-like ssDNA-binding domain-containing protein [Acidicapsa ligni]|uniref:ArdC-like ssDNA-binding domain-containing protein n=1 Tax=Acidicapsa ligni TaxID=542300 RepID=UPI0037C04A6A
MNPQDKPPPRDFRQEMTDEIIRLLESGAAPWQQPWEGGNGGLPYNLITPLRPKPIVAVMFSAS